MHILYRKPRYANYNYSMDLKIFFFCFLFLALDTVRSAVKSVYTRFCDSDWSFGAKSRTETIRIRGHF